MLTAPLTTLEQMLARSPSFQAWVGAQGEEEALNYVHHRAYDGTTYPNAVVDDSELGIPFIANDTYKLDGILGIYFNDTLPAEYLNEHEDVSNYREVFVAFSNQVGAIIEDLLAAANTPGNLIIKDPGIVRIDGPALDDHDQQGAPAPRLIWTKYAIYVG